MCACSPYLELCHGYALHFDRNTPYAVQVRTQVVGNVRVAQQLGAALALYQNVANLVQNVHGSFAGTAGEMMPQILSAKYALISFIVR
jgi:hypothetical protein